MEKMPHRAFDVGIAEQHAVTLSAGMATQGMKVFCNIYSSFMQRAYDQVVHDTAIQKLPVIFCLDRAGLVGDDGPTHHGCYDIAYMRCIPNMVVSAPMNESELRNLMYTAQLESTNLPFVIRYPRGEGVMPEWKTEMKEIKIGTGRKISGQCCTGPRALSRRARKLKPMTYDPNASPHQIDHPFTPAPIDAAMG